MRRVEGTLNSALVLNKVDLLLKKLQYDLKLCLQRLRFDFTKSA